MIKFAFTITGNPDNLAGNPIGYVRTTQRQMHVDERFKRYSRWKSAVVSYFLEKHPQFGPTYMTQGKPIYLAKAGEARMDLHIVWADETHGDPDNVFKGIADALFVNDKHLAGSFTFEHANGPGKVSVAITLYDHGET